MKRQGGEEGIRSGVLGRCQCQQTNAVHRMHGGQGGAALKKAQVGDETYLHHFDGKDGGSERWRIKAERKNKGGRSAKGKQRKGGGRGVGMVDGKDDWPTSPQENPAKRSAHFTASMRSIWILGRLTGSVEAAESGELWCRRNFCSTVTDGNLMSSASSALRLPHEVMTLAPALSPYDGHNTGTGQVNEENDDEDDDAEEDEEHEAAVDEGQAVGKEEQMVQKHAGGGGSERRGTTYYYGDSTQPTPLRMSQKGTGERGASMIGIVNTNLQAHASRTLIPVAIADRPPIENEKHGAASDKEQVDAEEDEEHEAAVDEGQAVGKGKEIGPVRGRCRSKGTTTGLWQRRCTDGRPRNEGKARGFCDGFC